MKEIIRKFTALGLSEYEAKVYLSLLGKNPATAYEMGKSSGVPTSKVYEVIKKLLQRGLLTVMQEKGTKRYVPLEPEEFLERHRASVEAVIGSLRNDLEAIRGDSELSHIWNISDYEFFIAKAVRMIDSARKTVLLSLWSEEMGLLEESVTKALTRGVKAAAVHFGRPDHVRSWPVYHHPIEHTLYREKGGRGLVVVTDAEEVLMGTVLKGNRVEGAWSTNRGFVTVAEDYVKHDIYIMKIVKRFDRDLRQTFGDRYVKLRDIFSDEEAE